MCLGVKLQNWQLWLLLTSREIAECTFNSWHLLPKTKIKTTFHSPRGIKTRETYFRYFTQVVPPYFSVRATIRELPIHEMNHMIIEIQWLNLWVAVQLFDVQKIVFQLSPLLFESFVTENTHLEVLESLLHICEREGDYHLWSIWAEW